MSNDTDYGRTQIDDKARSGARRVANWVEHVLAAVGVIFLLAIASVAVGVNFLIDGIR